MAINGTQQFHGSASCYDRNEFFNANDYFDNLNRIARNAYRYENPGYTVGGPLVIPGTGFNNARNKLLFFWSERWLLNKSASSLSRITFPTTLERHGDFSQSRDTSGEESFTCSRIFRAVCCAFLSLTPILAQTVPNGELVRDCEGNI